MFCRDCLLSVFREQMIRSKDTKVTNAPAVVVGGTCPVCHDSVKMSSIVHITKSVNGQAVSKFLDQPLTQSDKENSPNASTEINQRISTARVTLESALNGASSSKLEAILEELEKVRNDGKILIFSQYLGFLDIIGKALDKLGVETFRIDGKLSLKERVSAMSNFNKSQQGSVFLISMKAGGVGLNLVAASTVFIVDPWWNQALEDQCESQNNYHSLFYFNLLTSSSSQIDL
jgi:SNF2 family DNA or RNA helicase